MKIEHTKPFDPAAAKAGAPYACRGGFAATVFKWDASRRTYPIIGMVDYGKDGEMPVSWAADGSHLGSTEEHHLDLVMTPLGEIDGKPVFVGDRLEQRVRDGWVPHDARPDWASQAIDWEHDMRWPAPAKQYPVTAMTADDLVNSAAEVLGVVDAKARTKIEIDFGNYGMKGPLRTDDEIIVAIANAALRHAVDSGQVIPREEYLEQDKKWGKAEQLLETLGWICQGGAWSNPRTQEVWNGFESIMLPLSRQQHAARDMAVAEAVRDACVKIGSENRGTYDPVVAIVKLLHNGRLDEIIATIR